MHSAQLRAPHEGTLPQRLFHGELSAKTDNAHRVYYETINVRYTLVQSSEVLAKDVVAKKYRKHYVVFW